MFAISGAVLGGLWFSWPDVGAEGAVIIDTARRNQQASSDLTSGYNVLTDEYGSMLAHGAVHPVKVTPLGGAERCLHRRPSR